MITAESAGVLGAGLEELAMDSLYAKNLKDFSCKFLNRNRILRGELELRTLAPGGNMAKEQESSVAPEMGVQPEGATVLQEVVQMTGLPEDYLNSEISQFLGTT